jgi:hypothetical protein
MGCEFCAIADPASKNDAVAIPSEMFLKDNAIRISSSFAEISTAQRVPRIPCRSSRPLLSVRLADYFSTLAKLRHKANDRCFRRLAISVRQSSLAAENCSLLHSTQHSSN